MRNAGNALHLHYVEADALGTPRVVIDPTRDVAVWRWDLSSEAFGESEPQQDPDGDETLFVLDLRYPGQQYDSASGFNYNYFRDYDPSVGRYVQSDPIGLGGGISTYGYVGGNPMVRTDPDGLLWNLVARIVVGGVARGGARAAASPAVNSRMIGLTALAGAGAAYYGSRLARDLSAIAGTVHGVGGSGSESGEGESCPPTTEVASLPPNGSDGDDEDDPEITKSEHAKLRQSEGRNTGKLVNDIQNARPSDIYVQAGDGRFVIRGPGGREHIIEANGEHVTTINSRTNASHLNLLRNEVRAPATEEQVQFIRSLINK